LRANGLSLIGCVVVLLMIGLTEDAAAQNTAASAPTPPASEPVRQIKMSFAELGVGAMELRGIQSIGAVNLGTRLDEVIVGAKLRLRMTYSPAMMPELSHVRVSLNGQVLAALPLPKEQAGREIEREIVLDSRYFSDFNQIRFDLIGHYTLQCEDPQHSSLWVTISGNSELELQSRPLELRNDLALLPAPFFDRRDNRRLVLPVLLPGQPSRAVLRSAGIAASWFGALADYRGARFPVSLQDLPDRHALVFATNASRPAQLKLPEVQTPTISVVDHPNDPLVKLLVLQGKDDAQLLQAVEGLVLGNPVLTGASASIADVKYERRAAYDAPRWVRSDRAVKLGELVGAVTELQVSGISPPPIRVNLRLPPDLFAWNRSGVPMDLRYRYTAPREADNSTLSVSINNQLLRSYRLRPDPESATAGKLLVPLLQQTAGQHSEDLLIPAFQLASNNQMEFRFSLEAHRDGLCAQVFVDDARSAVDPDSTIDISDFPHYTPLPNLALFANSGYPFTRYADLAETAIVIPDKPTAQTLQQLLFVLGRMGRHTGTAAVAFTLLDVNQVKSVGDMDLLFLTSAESNRLLGEWGQDLSLLLGENGRRFREGDSVPAFANGRSRFDGASEQRSEVNVQASGSLGALLGFESPRGSNRSVVALVGSDGDAADSLVDALEDEGKVPFIRGDLAIVRAGVVQSYQGDDIYYAGSLPWWKWIWFHLSRHPVLLTLLTLAVAVVLAMWIYGWLQRRVATRLGTRAE
jgi:cellulose synthase operon protein B